MSVGHLLPAVAEAIWGPLSPQKAADVAADPPVPDTSPAWGRTSVDEKEARLSKPYRRLC